MKNKQTLVRLGQYLMLQKYKILLILILTVVSNVLLIATPALSGKAIDAISAENGVNMQEIFYYCGLMVVCFIVAAILSYMTTILFATVGQKTAYELRGQIFDKLMSLPMKSFEKHQSGDLISRFTYDVNTITTSLTNDIIQILTAAITVGGAAMMMYRISLPLLCIYLLIIPAEIIYVRYRAKTVRPLFRNRSKAIGDLCDYIEEKVTGVKTIRAYSTQQHYCDEFMDKNQSTSDAQYRAEYAGSAMFPVMNFISNIALSLITLLGIMLYLIGYMTMGSISTFILYSRKLLGSINEFSNIYSDLQSTFAASERIFTLLDQDVETDSECTVHNPHIMGNVEVRNLDFGYTSEKQVLKEISLAVHPGQTIAIVGATGSGKTTLISLLMRFYDADCGTISLDGYDYSSLTRLAVRQSYSMVLQDTWLFQDTVYNNIAYGLTDVTEEQVVAAAKAANVHDIIMAMPDGYQTVLSENAVNLSKGQKQLITIARAMIQRTPLLILDEATSNVDISTELRIHKAMQTLLKNRTCFIIAHRLSTIVNADNILVMSDGEIVEQGTHQALLQTGGAYSSLYHSQFE